MGKCPLLAHLADMPLCSANGHDRIKVLLCHSLEHDGGYARRNRTKTHDRTGTHSRFFYLENKGQSQNFWSGNAFAEG